MCFTLPRQKLGVSSMFGNKKFGSRTHCYIPEDSNPAMKVIKQAVFLRLNHHKKYVMKGAVGRRGNVPHLPIVAIILNIKMLTFEIYEP
jgi:hypothetical protein